jgi:mannose-1-phosphate guanylyltransferase/phosphomannomutase
LWWYNQYCLLHEKTEQAQIVMITQAVILSAGFGTRLKPLTDTMPKVMIPIGNKPLLQWHIEGLRDSGVKEFFINLHYLPSVVMDYFGTGQSLGVKIHYVVEPVIRGTAGGVKNFEMQVSDTFFVIYGDIFSLVDYSRLASIYINKAKPNLGMELVRDTDHPFDSDLVELDGEMRFKKIYRKPHRELPAIYKGMSGIFVFNDQILKYIPLHEYWDIDHQLLPDIITKGEVFYGCEPSPSDFWKDVGTMERYLAIEGCLKNLGK